MTRRRDRRGGFTLVELVLVMALLGIVGASVGGLMVRLHTHARRVEQRLVAGRDLRLATQALGRDLRFGTPAAASSATELAVDLGEGGGRLTRYRIVEVDGIPTLVRDVVDGAGAVVERMPLVADAAELAFGYRAGAGDTEPAAARRVTLSLAVDRNLGDLGYRRPFTAIFAVRRAP